MISVPSFPSSSLGTHCDEVPLRPSRRHAHDAPTTHPKATSTLHSRLFFVSFVIFCQPLLSAEQHTSTSHEIAATRLLLLDPLMGTALTRQPQQPLCNFRAISPLSQFSLSAFRSCRVFNGSPSPFLNLRRSLQTALSAFQFASKRDADSTGKTAQSGPDPFRSPALSAVLLPTVARSAAHL